MTLILAFAWPTHVFQVTDRLLTDTSEQKPFDPMANKNVIYRARDAIVSMAYTGHAYINGIPTDQWIVEKLRGEAFPQQERMMAVSFGPNLHWMDVGQSIQHLQTELNRVLDANARQSFQLMVVGWKRERRKRCAPILWCSEYHASSGQLETNRRPRDWQYSSNYPIVGAPDANVSLAELKAAMARIKPTRSTEEIEEVLEDTIRKVSQNNNMVGPNCMSIHLPHPNLSPVVKATYRPLQPGQAIMYTDEWRRTIPAAYSPWLLGSNTTVTPAIVVGKGWRFGLDSFEVQFDGPESPGGPEGVFSRQDRPMLV